MKLPPHTWWWARLMLILIGVAAYFIHITPHLQRQLLGAPLGDTPSILLDHQDRVYHFDFGIPQGNDENGFRRIGSFRQRLGLSDTFYIIDSSFRLDQDHGLSQLMAVTPWGTNRSLRADMRLEIDDRWRPVGISGNLRYARSVIDIIGAFHHQGLDGHVAFSDDQRTPFSIEQLGSSHDLAFHPAMALPANLSIGDRFSLPSISAQPTPPFISATTLTFVVEAEESIPTAAGATPCLRLAVFHHGHQVLVLWADQQGVIYRLGDDDTLIQAHLIRITNLAGDPLWPPQDLP